MKVEFYKHHLGPEEKKAVLKVLDSIFLTSAHKTSEFESKFAKYLKVKHCIFLSSCTAGLQLALEALGIGRGDEVITTPLTFVATSNSIIQAGAKPVFVDVEKDTGLIDLKLIEKKINRRTKAIMPVHLFGVMSDMRGIKRLADKYKLKIIEDAAHCVEGSRDGIKPGQLSDAAVFSFYATKNLTCGEGGCLVTNNKRLAERIYKMRHHGITKAAHQRYVKSYKSWDMKEFGWKYNISDMMPAMLIPQLDRIGGLWKKRKEVSQQYRKALSKIESVDSLRIPSKTKHALHLFTILASNRNKILINLQKRGVGCAVNYEPVHLLTYYKKNFGYKRGDFKNAENIGSKILSLPFYPSLKVKELRYVVSSLKRVI